ncbi:Ltp family lipoprotein [Sinomonas sp. R1AF57]|uniref:Ltp family lipoprotein n=1 Tax=Sinomonas sp. R1AF57 TaxID=2020377 RepID=UPI002100DF48|nr:Ltp family lipoprotein [Sinomonas sp. R1AF57]
MSTCNSQLGRHWQQTRPQGQQPQKPKRPFWKKKRFILPTSVVTAILAIAGCGGGSSSGSSVDTTSASSAAPAPSTAAAPVAPPAAPPPPPPAPKVPAEYQSALKQAESYSNMMHMSKQGIYDQLTSPYGGKFAPEAAQYAVDNLKADYNANALASAKSYQETMNMSPVAIYDQLVSPYGGKFTAAEAQYAVDHLGG